MKKLLLFLFIFLLMSFKSDEQYLWLEKIEGKEALSFATTESQKTIEHFKENPLFSTIEKEVQDVLYNPIKLPRLSFLGEHLFNLWQDAANPKGLLRVKNEAGWEVIFDLDKNLKDDLVYKNLTCEQAMQKCMMALSHGGKDAVIWREFDFKKKNFIEGGFELPEAKGSVEYIDENTLIVMTDFNADSITNSGYPRQIKIWNRKNKLSEEPIIFEGQKTDISASASYHFNDNIFIINRAITFYTAEYFIYDLKTKELQKIKIPASAELKGVFKGNLIFMTREKFNEWPAGSVLSLNLDTHLTKSIFTPTAISFVEDVYFSLDYLYLNTMKNVSGEIIKMDDAFKSTFIEHGKFGSSEVISTSQKHNHMLSTFTGFTTPTSQFLDQKILNKSPSTFDEDKFTVEQKWSKSKDGTAIPYFIIYDKEIKFNGQNPTLLYGYGGFEITMKPRYLSIAGKTWLSRGGVYVMANIRGGGEFGPLWHSSVVKENRPKVFEDFISVAESLIENKITSPKHLGIQGGSNGGLLTGATFIMRPDLFNAALIEVPLLDMLRYHKLLAGASWMDEYGNPEDVDMKKVIMSYSPFQNISSEIKYPKAFVLTSTKDDRVHPAHARKFVAKMKDVGKEIFYFENIEGGHSGAANIKQNINWITLEYTYLFEQLK